MRWKKTRSSIIFLYDIKTDLGDGHKIAFLYIGRRNLRPKLQLHDRYKDPPNEYEITQNLSYI